MASAMERHVETGPMLSPPLSTETLAQAVWIAGSDRVLAQRLGVSLEELEKWIDGEPLPMNVFMLAREFIAARGRLPDAEPMRRGVLPATVAQDVPPSP